MKTVRIRRSSGELVAYEYPRGVDARLVIRAVERAAAGDLLGMSMLTETERGFANHIMECERQAMEAHLAEPEEPKPA